MYDLTLDRSTVLLWSVLFGGAVALSLLSAAGLFVVIQQRRPWPVTLALLAAVLGSLAALGFSRFTPEWFYRHQLAPSVALGEALLVRYQAYRGEHGRYPAHLADVAFPELVHFNAVPQLGRQAPACNGGGPGCRWLMVELPDPATGNELRVIVTQDLFRCELTSVPGRSFCRDMR